MTYLGALSHGAHSITIRRDGLLIRWTLCTPACVITQHEGPPHPPAARSTGKNH